MRDKHRDKVSLNQFSRIQLYLGQEMIEKYEAGLLSWGRMLRSLILIGGSTAAAGAFLAASSGPDSGSRPPIRIPEFKFQPATGPLVVKEDDPDLETATVSFQSDTEVYGYLARPKAASSTATSRAP